MGAKRKDRRLDAGGSDEGTAKDKRTQEKTEEGKSPQKDRERRAEQWQREEQRLAHERAEEERAIEDLLRTCQRKAQCYEPGGETIVEKDPRVAPGQAETMREI